MPGVDTILTGLWSDPRPTDAEIATIGTMVLEQFVGSEPADPVRDPRITRVLAGSLRNRARAA
jgi:hypothetical protein